jgi:hypothetical protein
VRPASRPEYRAVNRRVKGALMPTNAISAAKASPRKSGARRRAAGPDKVVLTNRSALVGKYGTRGVARIDTALAKLIDADRGRGIATVVIALDDPDAMAVTGAAPVTDVADAAGNKSAVDAVYRTYTPDYVMLLGSIDVIPHQPLRNPVYDGVNDVDRLAYGDLPYACNAPYSDDPTDFIGPDRVVGRLADVTGASTPTVLVKLLGRAVSWSSRPRSDYEAHLGITANVWQRSTVLSLRKLFAAAEVHSSPGEGPGWERTLLRRRVHFINCHGAESEPRFFGQEGSNYPVSHESAQVAGRVSPGTIVAAECCYGCELWAPTDDVLSMPMAYLANGAAGYWGASTIAYGPADANGDADLVCAYFVAAVLDGASIGRAALEARQRFVRGTTVLSPVSTKTLAQFNLLGDPSVHPVLPVATPKARVAQARKGRRERLLELAIANLRDTSITREEAVATRAVGTLDTVLTGDTPMIEPHPHTFAVAPPPLAAILPPPPQVQLDADARFQVVLGQGETTGRAAVGLVNVVAVEAREEGGQIVARRVLHSK